MGRRLLLNLCALLALTVAACGTDPDTTASAPGDGARADSAAVGRASLADRAILADSAHAAAQRSTIEDGHAGLACARCHDGERIERDVAAATSDGCIDCHEDGGPRTVSLGAVTIEHRVHAGDTALASGCASCHTHGAGGEPLAVTTTGCALCHAASLDGSTADGCRLCHTDPAHVALTSQNVTVVHGDLPWIGGECVRCHFDVGRPGTAVAAASCASCHLDAAAVTERGAGSDLHPSHTGVTCSGCHEDVTHRIVAMSSGVHLDCAQCHAGAHDTDPTVALEADMCNDCHTSVHAAEQRLMLGAAPAGLAAAPGDKFLLGMTCRSCHVPTDGGTASRTSCVGCHPPQYATVLSWWERGSAERVALTAAYIAGARDAAASAGDSARFHAAAADSLLRFVRQGGPAHNLPLSHRALETATERAAAAWTAAGRTPPARPDLGTAPRMGQCTYCHYEWRQPRFQPDMPDAFHRRVMQRGRDAASRIGAGQP